LVIAAVLAVSLAWFVGTVAKQLGGTDFIAYCVKQLTKPAAYVIAIVYSIGYTLFAAFEVRAIANISKQYLFENTPVEVVALVFLLVVLNALFGSRVGIIRLNTLFIPIVMVVGGIVLLF